MISGAGTSIDRYDMSVPNPVTGRYYVSTTYHYQEGIWENSPKEPPPFKGTPPPKGLLPESATDDGLESAANGAKKTE